MIGLPREEPIYQIMFDGKKWNVWKNGHWENSFLKISDACNWIAANYERYG